MGRIKTTMIKNSNTINYWEVFSKSMMNKIK